jgi:capsule polysaccharide modification protein KpsS
MRLIIKAHRRASGRLRHRDWPRAERVRRVGAGSASLLAAADAVVTMNSTVAIDALVLGVPALVIGLPNNLSPS